MGWFVVLGVAVSEGEGDGWCLTGVKLVLNTRGWGWANMGNGPKV